MENVEFDFSIFFIIRGFNGMNTTLLIVGASSGFVSFGRTSRVSLSDFDERSPDPDLALTGDLVLRETATVGIFGYWGLWVCLVLISA